MEQSPLARLAAFLLGLLMLAAPAGAQDRETLAAPFVDWPGIFEKTGEGQYTGFYVELTRAIAAEAGFDLRFVEYDVPRDAIGAQARGETQIIAGPPITPALSGNLVSDPFGQISTYLFVQAQGGGNLALEDMAGRRIGVVDQAAGSDLGDLGGLAGEVVAFPDIRDAFGALIMGRVDGVVTTYKFAMDLLRTTGLDYRVVAVDPPLRTETIHALLAPGNEAYLPRVNAAIAKLGADGTLDRLLRDWNVLRPAAVPPVLSVGVAHFPPYQVVGEDGSFTGYGVEALRQLAERAGLALDFRTISSDEWSKGPSDTTYDMLPPLSITEAKRQQMDFTIPLQESPYSLFLRAGETRDIRSLRDLAGLRVGVTRNSWARSLVGPAPDFTEVVFDDEDLLLDGLLAGEIDSALFARATFNRLMDARGVASKVVTVEPPIAVSERAVGLRPGLATVRERLNGVIPGYLSSESYQVLRERWLNPPPFWTPERLRLARLAAVAALVTLLLGVFTAILLGRRRALRHAEAMESLSNRLGAIFNTTRSGILGFNRAGEIAVANTGALELIGQTTTPTPFRWPETIAFVDPESMSPLVAAQHPITRALGGGILKGELSLMRQGAAEPITYVRISSSPVAAALPADISSVVILDNVTEEERNRQTAERAGRLDALGRMTGGIAHDFNNMLATIEYAAVLAEKSSAGKPRDYIAAILRTVRRGSDLTRRLLAFARLDPGNAASTSVDDFMKEFRKLGKLTIEPAITLDFEVAEQGMRVFCDPGQLENALLNLVINGRDAITSAHKGDRIVVGVQSLPAPPGGTALVEFAVSDNGPGMSEEIKRRATDPFFTTKDKASGTGLGLSMVYGFVERMGGELRIDSELGKGTTVHMILPAGDAVAQVEARPDRAELATGKGQRILIAEDDPALLDLVADVVESLRYRVVKARSGEDALALVTQGELFDLLLTDVVMPGGMGGFALAREVRKLAPGLPVVYMSGYTGLSREAMGSVPGPLLQKPCAPRDLAHVLQSELLEGAAVTT